MYVFVQDSSLDSMDIERQYQSNQQGQLAFTAGCYSYILYFNGRSNTNHLTYLQFISV